MAKLRVVAIGTPDSKIISVTTVDITQDEISKLLFNKFGKYGNALDEKGNNLVWQQELDVILNYVQERDFKAKIQKVLNDTTDM